ncbi:MAG: hypothetical protein IJ593_01100 [Lachnospiraceae bacterium]|nr:hypothetical protein [Lachnospiraceae bacterium]
MSIKFDFKGFQKLQNDLKKISKKVNKSSISFDKVFTSKFMKINTPYSSFDDMMQAGNFDISSSEAFENIPDKDLDVFISKNTKYKSWQELLDDAVSQYIFS